MQLSLSLVGLFQRLSSFVPAFVLVRLVIVFVLFVSVLRRLFSVVTMYISVETIFQVDRNSARVPLRGWAGEQKVIFTFFMPNVWESR